MQTTPLNFGASNSYGAAPQQALKKAANAAANRVTEGGAGPAFGGFWTFPKFGQQNTQAAKHGSTQSWLA